ncbi:MAG: hypothetical protein GY788_23150 [bacterium]|nr:hypothetical protein [bacterium]
MKFNEILSRVTGLSSPVFGVSWAPKEPEVAVARRVIAYLEDRRVLYVPSEMEVPHHCVESVLDIRRRLTDELASIDAKSGIAETLRALRAACRKFLNTVQAKNDIVTYGADAGHWASWVFNGALGEMRGVFGVHIAKIAASYGLDVDGELSSILPEKDAGDE